MRVGIKNTEESVKKAQRERKENVKIGAREKPYKV
jgi:hypothetical protein